MSTVSDATDRLAELQAKVDALINERAKPAFADAADRVSQAANQAGDYARTGSDQLASKVRDQPLIAIGAAAAVGYLIGRFTR
jgi:ElaB/YqjD/DUF883 family membrane-anchored ribosome-binding protein